MLLATIRKNDKTETFIFYSWGEFHSFTFGLDIDVLSVFPLKVHGKTYAERKANAKQLAIDFSNSKCCGLSWGELEVISVFFEKIGKRYGLLSEFRENGIC